MGKRERISFQRDLERWCFRIETTVETRVWAAAGGGGGGGGAEREDRERLMIEEDAIEALLSLSLSLRFWSLRRPIVSRRSC